VASRAAAVAPAAPAAPGRSTILAGELGGNLPCLRCKYDLKGLSIRAVCPECALPVRATLLAVVDPMAGELQPIPRPLLTATGLLTWSTAALLAALCVWVMRALVEYESGAPLAHRAVEVLGPVVAALTLLSGVGALALVKPHGRIPAGQQRLALMGALVYLPLALVMWWLHVDVASAGFGLGPFQGHAMSTLRSELRVLADGLMVLIILALRPNARLLATRSLLMRTGRVDRQTMLGLVAVLGLSMAGDASVLVATEFPGPVGQTMRLIGLVVVLVSSVLLTIGLVGVMLDCWRMRPVVVESPVSLERVLGEQTPTAPTTAPTPTGAAGRAGVGGV
jgi:hypothetical protein